MKDIVNTFIACCLSMAAVYLLWIWNTAEPVEVLELRKPGADLEGVDPASIGHPEVDLTGTLVKCSAKPSQLPGSWPGFRGPDLSNISKETVPLARSWPDAGPPVLWSREVGEGYAGVAVSDGCVYLMDYNREKSEDTLVCLSLETGEDIWRFSYEIEIKRFHGMSRTIPRISGDHVVAIGPKNHVSCLNKKTGDRYWSIDMVKDWGAEVPQWYAGQCPIIDGDKAILAPAGKALMIAVKLDTGEVLWETPNPRKWKMTHSSIVPMEFEGTKMYVYCANKGVVGVSAEDGKLLWDTTAWHISIATVPTPILIPGGRLFFTGGYNAGSAMLQLSKAGDGSYSIEELYKLSPNDFACKQQTPILYQDHLYGMKYNGEFACLDFSGKERWSSGSEERYGKGYGPYLMADGLFFIMDDQAKLIVAEATPQGYTKLDEAVILDDGHDSWAPIALAGGRMIVRDMTRMVCLDVRKERSTPDAN